MVADEPGESIPGFNLVHDPWVLVRLLNGGILELSLVDTFKRLDEIESLAGEASVQDAAMLRLLLAIAHSALGPSTTQSHDPAFESPVLEWKALWQDRTRFSGIVSAYLGDWASRFELFDTARPFYQVAGLTTGKDELGPLVRLVLDVPNDEEKQYFTTRAGAGVASLSFAEAARWLVTVQAFDVSGIKSGVVGDPRTKGGRGYPIGPAFAAQLGLVYVAGSNLAETLLLNLVRGGAETVGWHSAAAVSAADIAPWEREGNDAIGVGVRNGTRDGDELAPVEGIVDALTWQARRVLLQHDGSRVVGVIIANGDRANTDNRFAVEFMTPWRQPLSGVASKTAAPVLKPRRHDVEQAFWRGLSGVLPSLSAATDGRGRAVRPPGVLSWIRQLQEEEVLTRAKRVRVRAIGLKLDSNNAIVQDSYDDGLDLDAVLVGTDAEARQLAAAIQREVHATEQAVLALGRYAENLAIAAGNRDSDVRSRALERGYFAIDAPFRRWIFEIHAGMDPLALDGHEVEWRRRAYTSMLRLGDELADEVSDAGLIGHQGFGGKQMDVGLARQYFERSLRQALPIDTASPTNTEKEPALAEQERGA